MNRLEKLCSPLIECICEYWRFSQAGVTFSLQDFQRDINQHLSDIREQCVANPQIAKEFSRIERPLIFFIDYTIKEGHFPFSGEWCEMARNYNELTGDEKFFDLLSEALEDPDAEERINIFYYLMGLGFDGIYRRDKEFIERKMKVCAKQTATGFDVSKELITPAPQDSEENAVNKPHLMRTCKFWFIMSILFLAAAMVYNYIVFDRTTDAYADALDDSSRSASDDALSFQKTKRPIPSNKVKLYEPNK